MHTNSEDEEDGNTAQGSSGSASDSEKKNRNLLGKKRIRFTQFTLKEKYKQKKCRATSTNGEA
ncbi:uncharacterized protein SETTUDRAFT_21088 [Exserohilum turcica Et28A]|uniref:Uncharacterized protein n=1 Tax=Exserohilum turcicum (strain 28A) TaxID=671987 RepID=R0IEL6_EXST2|nr:uncharacterized protein SETTUDRAFT_21088 [Exserohilum turcica Et28A]EOA83735.1 hypothetical protein SETTUDRAFT_21088 [Exserohilum turcica Et28A]